MIKVLHLTTDLGLGGRERVIVDLSNALLDMGYLPSICCLHRSGAWADRLQNDVEVFELRKKDRLDLTVVKPLKDYLIDREIDILHAHNPGTLLYGLLAAKWAGTPAIINTEHGFASQLSLKARLKDKLLYRYVACITAVSDSLRNDLVSTFGLEDRKVQTLRNGILSAKIDQEPSVSRKKIGMSEDRLNIGIVARLVPVKNHRMLFETFSIVRERHPAVRLWVIGSGQLRTRLEKQARMLGIQNDVVFMGSRTDVPVILNALHLFVLCSFSEGLSITLLEAMSAGLPIVATNVGGNSEVIEHGKSGLLVESDRPEDLAHSILKLIANKDLAKKMGITASQRFMEQFYIERMAQKVDKLYRSVLEEKDS